MNAQELEWNDLHVVLAVCRYGTLSAAARSLGINHSTVFRRIVAIEEKIAVRLFERLPTGYVMTKAGEAVFASAERVETEIFNLSRKLIGSDLRLSGDLRVTAPDALAMMILMPIIARFRNRYPGIEINITVENGFLDLSQREADVAIRSTNTPPETMIGHRLCGLGATIYGSNEYLEHKTNTDLNGHNWLMPQKNLDWFSANKWLKRNYADAPIVFRSNTLLGLFEAVKQNIGIAPLPFFLADPLEELSRLIEPPKEFYSQLWLLTHPDLRRTARIMAFTDFISESLKDVHDCIEGKI